MLLEVLGVFVVGSLYWAPFALAAAACAVVLVSAPVVIASAARRATRRAPSSPTTFFRGAQTEHDGRLNLETTDDPHFVAAAAKTTVRAAGAGKRAVDIAAALALLIFFAPLLALVAILIKLDSPGPVLYRQRRVGRDGQVFDILKFRSMVADAEKNGVRWARKNDDRVTRVGRIIRKLRIDEMPQAVNILRGDMSFVGPRPERPEFVKLLESEVPAYTLRHAVRPGLTGWAQVKYVYGASVEDARVKLQYDLYYIKHFSLWRDFLIMLMTVRVALLGVGSR
ncbi:MAG: exopolysaccharide biosynthesis polyprenyl glycosylphosphotransferase [Parvularculaceae bacterium]|nr:exopolysaccharide biosynthesis polyprenyl glycosylphosphotransferase [Parvularculaceae bacterium]